MISAQKVAFFLYRRYHKRMKRRLCAEEKHAAGG